MSYIAIMPNQIAETVFDGLTRGMLYVLLALGLNIILGLMGVINFSHGAFFALGAYITFTLSSRIGLFPAILVAALCMAVLGMIMESVFIRRLYGRPPEHVLMFTFGMFLIFVQVIRKVWGDTPQPLSPTGWLAGSVNLGFSHYPTFRLVVVLVTVVVLVLVYLMLVRTNLGLIIRAGTRDSQMVSILGHQHAVDVHRGVRPWLASRRPGRWA